MRGENPHQTAEPTTSQSESALFQLVENGPASNVEALFAEVLTVPQELRQRIFYWPEERDFCEHVSLVGRALDTLTAVHRTFLGQFKVLSSLRSSLLQAPTEFFVAPAYFCDRALDSLLHSTRKVQNDLKGLFANLSRLEAECSMRHEWTKRAFLEDRYPKGIASRNESRNRPDMKVKEQRVLLLAELGDRIKIVRREGTQVLNLRYRSWLPGEPSRLPQPRPDDNGTVTANNEAVRGPIQEPSVDAHNANVNPEESAKDTSASPIPPPRTVPRLPVAEAEKEPEGSSSFEVPPSQNVVDELQGSGSFESPIPPIAGKKSKTSDSVRIPVHRKEISSVETARVKVVEVPETPEALRIGAVVVTQTSSPRRRKPSQSSGTSDATESANRMQNVVRTL